LNTTTAEKKFVKRLGKKLRSLRGDKSLRDAAIEIGIQHTLLGRYEHGLQVPGAIMLRRISKAYGLSIDEIVR